MIRRHAKNFTKNAQKKNIQKIKKKNAQKMPTKM